MEDSKVNDDEKLSTAPTTARSNNKRKVEELSKEDITTITSTEEKEEDEKNKKNNEGGDENDRHDEGEEQSPSKDVKDDTKPSTTTEVSDIKEGDDDDDDEKKKKKSKSEKETTDTTTEATTTVEEDDPMVVVDDEETKKTENKTSSTDDKNEGTTTTEKETETTTTTTKKEQEEQELTVVTTKDTTTTTTTGDNTNNMEQPTKEDKEDKEQPSSSSKVVVDPTTSTTSSSPIAPAEEVVMTTTTTEEGIAPLMTTEETPTNSSSTPPTTTTTKISSSSTPEETSKSKKQSSSSTTNPYDLLRWIVITNDSKPESLIKLVALKSLFAKQLPKMPRTYIARLVFDRRHTSLAILSDDPTLKDTDEEVIGSICYRAFPDMRFAEIAFCAVNASHQVKGYGTKLMNLLKREGARTGIEYFITYADNYAIGYFKKQGFTKSISMPKGRYTGLIKDYDGGTMMECYVHPSIDFTRIPQMISAQKQFLLSRIRLKAKSNQVYNPLPDNFNPNLEGVSRANEAAARAMAIPGIREAGWTLPDLLVSMGQGKDVDRAKNVLKSELLQMIRKIEEQQYAWPFREPVDTTEVLDYLDIITEPIDLSTIDKRIRQGDHYKSKQMLYTDLMLMVNNCKRYNDETSTYVQCAISLEKYLTTLFRDMR